MEEEMPPQTHNMLQASNNIQMCSVFKKGRSSSQSTTPIFLVSSRKRSLPSTPIEKSVSRMRIISPDKQNHKGNLDFGVLGYEALDIVVISEEAPNVSNAPLDSKKEAPYVSNAPLDSREEAPYVSNAPLNSREEALFVSNASNH